jgi:hypothetical protein
MADQDPAPAFVISPVLALETIIIMTKTATREIAVAPATASMIARAPLPEVVSIFLVVTLAMDVETLIRTLLNVRHYMDSDIVQRTSVNANTQLTRGLGASSKPIPISISRIAPFKNPRLGATITKIKSEVSKATSVTL